MKTSIWGPSAWRFLHAVTFAYPETPTQQHVEAAEKLFTSLKLMLPCDECCGHYCSAMETTRLRDALQSRTTLTRWLWEFHNNVNRRLGKPEYAWEQLTAEFQGEGTECAIESSCGDAEETRIEMGVHAEKQGESKCPTSSVMGVLPTVLALVGLFVVFYLMFSR